MKYLLTLLIIFSLLVPTIVFAKLVPDCGGPGEEDCTLCHFLLLIKNIIVLITEIAFAIAALFFIVGGISFLISSGSPEKIEKAKKTITSAVIGMVIVLTSYLIVVSVIVALGGKEAYFKLDPNNLGKGFVIINCE